MIYILVFEVLAKFPNGLKLNARMYSAKQRKMPHPCTIANHRKKAGGVF
jgi:hypothetical protein